MNDLRYLWRNLTQGTIALRSLFDKLKRDGGEWEIVVRPLKSRRSIEQNKRYWALLREMAALVWVNGRQFSDEVWAEHCKRAFIGVEEYALPNGEVEKRGISTTRLSVDEFQDYMRSIEDWCETNGFPVMREAA